MPENRTDWNTMTSLDQGVSTATDAPTQDAPVVTKADLRRAAWGSSAGSALEYYDFALYSLASALVFGPLLFPGGNAATGLVLSFATYFIGFAIRPLGGVFLGRLGDRLGPQVRPDGHHHDDGPREHMHRVAAHRSRQPRRLVRRGGDACPDPVDHAARRAGSRAGAEMAGRRSG
jgi:hypothetical protein